MPRFSARNAIVLANVILLTTLIVHLKTVLWDENPGRASSLFADLADDQDGYDRGDVDEHNAVLGLNGVKSDREWASSEGKTLQINGGPKRGSVESKKEKKTAVVIASQASENTTWITEFFPQWEQNIYRLDDPSAKLTVPKNKGRESMVYLTYVALQPLDACFVLLFC